MNSEQTPSVDQKVACLFLAEQDFVKGLAIYYAPWPGIADDIVQQVFLEFVTHQERWDLEKEIRPLLGVMTRNIARRFWREKIRNMPESLKQVAEHLEAASRDTEPDECYDAKRRALDECMKTLGPKSRALIDMRYFGMMKPAEMAERLQAKTATITQALYRLRGKLYDCILARMEMEGGFDD